MVIYSITIPDMDDFDIAAHLGIKINSKEQDLELGKDEKLQSNSCLDLPTINHQNTLEQLQSESQNHKDFEEKQATHQNDFFDETTSNISGSSESKSINPSNNGDDCPHSTTIAPEVYSPPPLPKDWQPAVGDSIRAKQDDIWCVARITAIPNDHPDPKKRYSNWKICLESGEESRVWELEDMRPLFFEIPP